MKKINKNFFNFEELFNDRNRDITLKLIPIWASFSIIYYGINLYLPIILIKMHES